MKMLLKIITVPIALILDLLTLIFIGLISCSTILFRLASGVIALIAAAVLVTYSVKNGVILLTIAFLVSPMGLPMLAVWALGKIQGISLALKRI